MLVLKILVLKLFVLKNISVKKCVIIYDLVNNFRPNIQFLALKTSKSHLKIFYHKRYQKIKNSSGTYKN